MISIAMPDPRLLHHFPEATTLAVLHASLAAAELALRDQHPTADDIPLDPEHDVPPSLVTAHLIITRSIELRDLLCLYSSAVQRALRHHFDPDDRFF